ncbi:unnamed protein product [Moneuplotes crassus]|uniref:BTB domain-containing protein n=1 Tax=Euplotes crassus TaxID=5936 RepID=A0AAD1UC45_EUPCR|nr:unnamed protein product [Moneuplotes crassus]
MPQISVIDLGYYQLPRPFRNFEIKVEDLEGDKVYVLETNTLLLVQYSEFFVKYLKDTFNSQSDKEVKLQADVCSSHSVSCILKWMHCNFLCKLRSLPKSMNQKTTKARQRDSLTEILSEKSSLKDFDLFELFKTSEFFMVKKEFYDDLQFSLMLLTNEDTSVDLFEQILVISQYFGACVEQIKSLVMKFIYSHFSRIEGIPRLFEVFENNEDILNIIIMASHYLKMNDQKHLESYIDTLKSYFDKNVFGCLEMFRKAAREKLPNSVGFEYFTAEVQAASIYLNASSDIEDFEMIQLHKGTHFVWKVKIKLNDRKEIGVFFSPRIQKQDGRLVTGREDRSIIEKYGNFRTAFYNIQLENCFMSVYGKNHSLYSFPLTENYFFGPSNVATTPDIVNFLERNAKSSYHIKIQLYEDPVHSAIMNYIGMHFESLLIKASDRDLGKIDPKEFICLMESKIHQNLSPTTLLKIIDRYCIVKELSLSHRSQIMATISVSSNDLARYHEQSREMFFGPQSGYSIIFTPEYQRLLEF